MIDIAFLAALRGAELEEISRALPAGGRVLELGGGTGHQASMLAERGFDIVSVDVAGSIYREQRVFPVLEYDGRNLPFASHSFDAVMSSNVLEHVEDLDALHREMKRVLRPGGVGVHVLPTHGWRFWTSVAHYPDLLLRLLKSLSCLLPRSLSLVGIFKEPLRCVVNMLRLLVSDWLPLRHGERGNVLSEIGYFHPHWWRREFRRQGFRVVEDRPLGLFYTGYMLLGHRLGLPMRRHMSRLLGSSGHLFRVDAVSEAGGQS